MEGNWFEVDGQWYYEDMGKIFGPWKSLAEHKPTKPVRLWSDIPLSERIAMTKRKRALAHATATGLSEAILNKLQSMSDEEIRKL